MQGEDNLFELKGINRNASMLRSDDGVCDDLVNMRFKDGSWRTLGLGDEVFDMGGVRYTQLYVHTNVYSHLLGVRDGKLWWFANIDADDHFTSLETPSYLCDVTGDIHVSQTGHLLTVIDGDGRCNYLLYYTLGGEYREFEMDYNGKQDAAVLPPDGMIRFRMVKDRFSDGRVKVAYCGDNSNTIGMDGGNFDPGKDTTNMEVSRAGYLKIRDYLRKENSFSFPFLVCTALELYDGSYILMGRPQLMNPSAYTNSIGTTSLTYKPYERFVEQENKGDGIYIGKSGDRDSSGNFVYQQGCVLEFKRTVGYRADDEYMPSLGDFTSTVYTISGNQHIVYGSFNKLQISVYKHELLKKYGELVSRVCVFVTPEAELYDYDKMLSTSTARYDFAGGDFNVTRMVYPSKRSEDELLSDLNMSLFYCIARYEINNLPDGWTDVVLDDGVLSNLVQQERLSVDATTRDTYVPKYSFSYNGRLHLANYKTIPFHGWPIGYFGYTEKRGEGQYEGSAHYDDRNPYIDVSPTDSRELVARWNEAADALQGRTMCSIEVDIETEQGAIKVVRYLKPISPITVTEDNSLWTEENIEDLMPMLSYPDRRAKRMRFYWVQWTYAGQEWNNSFYMNSEDRNNYLEVELTPHSFYDFAYAIHADFKPYIIIDEMSGDFGEELTSLSIPAETGDELFPNGLRVSSVDNPLFFPVRNTYQVGSSEIVGMASNAIAVGTGQTGDAPLYVFCKDGIYAMFVDAQGEVAYTTARGIARDVCNNLESIKTTDLGVMFTTERGLMCLSGNEVIEIGQPLEGDLPEYSNESSVGYIKIASNAYRLESIADLPSSVESMGFLSYLKGSRIGYNHQMRELLVARADSSYMYVMDRYGNWSRLLNNAEEFVENYPRSYVLSSGKLYELTDADYSNGVFFITRALKLGNVGFKQAYRFIVRGFFETDNVFGCYVFGSYDGRRWAMIGGNEKSGQFTDIGCLVSRIDCKYFKVCCAGRLSTESRIDYLELVSQGSRLFGKKVR